VDVVESTLSMEEAHRAKKLMMHKYARKEWNIDAEQADEYLIRRRDEKS
jgi:hypothetical protein